MEAQRAGKTRGQAVHPDPAFRRQVEEVLGQTISSCYHCCKCSSGCPVAFAMDILPHKVVRMVQVGMKDEVLESSTIWLCASCQTCTTRCPNEIDIAGLMDALRQTAVRGGVPPAEASIPAFHAAFLEEVERRGRVYELGMLARLKLKTMGSGGLLEDAALGWEMLKRGKLKLLPRRIRRWREVRDIFRESRT